MNIACHHGGSLAGSGFRGLCFSNVSRISDRKSSRSHQSESGYSFALASALESNTASLNRAIMDTEVTEMAKNRISSLYTQGFGPSLERLCHREWAPSSTTTIRADRRPYSQGSQRPSNSSTSCTISCRRRSMLHVREHGDRQGMASSKRYIPWGQCHDGVWKENSYYQGKCGCTV